MPTYVYECRDCERTFEVEQRISEDSLTDCACGAKGSLMRLIQPTAVMFRGSGFHINDYQAHDAPGTPVAAENTDPAPSAGCGPEGCTPASPEKTD